MKSQSTPETRFNTLRNLSVRAVMLLMSDPYIYQRFMSEAPGQLEPFQLSFAAEVPDNAPDDGAPFDWKAYNPKEALHKFPDGREDTRVRVTVLVEPVKTPAGGGTRWGIIRAFLLWDFDRDDAPLQLLYRDESIPDRPSKWVHLATR